MTDNFRVKGSAGRYSQNLVAANSDRDVVNLFYGFLSAPEDLPSSVPLRDGGSRDGLDWVSATPRAGDTPFEKIDIGMGGGLPAAMLLTDSFGQTTLLRFTKFERNAAVDPQTFRFTPPPGADVMESR